MNKKIPTEEDTPSQLGAEETMDLEEEEMCKGNEWKVNMLGSWIIHNIIVLCFQVYTSSLSFQDTMVFMKEVKVTQIIQTKFVIDNLIMWSRIANTELKLWTTLVCFIVSPYMHH